MSSLSIQDIIRSTHVDRWQIVRTLRKQNVAEHSYLVTMIAQEVAIRVLGKDYSDKTKLLIYEWAMRHDLPEVYMGDICTPVKSRIRSAIGLDGKDPFNTIEQEICENCYSAKIKAGSLLRDIIKIADLIDGIRFMVMEGHGNHAEHVKKKLMKLLDKKTLQCSNIYPGYNWTEVVVVFKQIMDDECGYLNFEGNNV